LKLGRVGVSARLLSSERSMDRLLAKVPASAPHLSFEVRTSRVNSPPPEALQYVQQVESRRVPEPIFITFRERDGQTLHSSFEFQVSSFKTSLRKKNAIVCAFKSL